MSLFHYFQKSSNTKKIERIADKCHALLRQHIVVMGLEYSKQCFLFKETDSSQIHIDIPAVLQTYKVDHDYALYKLSNYDAFVVVGELEAMKNYRGTSDPVFLASPDGNSFISEVSLEAAERLSANHKDVHIFR